MTLRLHASSLIRISVRVKASLSLGDIYNPPARPQYLAAAWKLGHRNHGGSRPCSLPQPPRPGKAPWQWGLSRDRGERAPVPQLENSPHCLGERGFQKRLHGPTGSSSLGCASHPLVMSSPRHMAQRVYLPPSVIKLHGSSSTSPHTECDGRGLQPRHLPTHFAWRDGGFTRHTDHLGSRARSTALCTTLSNLE